MTRKGWMCLTCLEVYVQRHCRLWLQTVVVWVPIASRWSPTSLLTLTSDLHQQGIFPMHMDIFIFFFQIILCKPWTLLWSESPAAQLETQQPPSPRSKSLGTPSISSFCLLNADWLFKQLKIELCKLAGASISVWANNVSWTGKKNKKNKWNHIQVNHLFISQTMEVLAGLGFSAFLWSLSMYRYVTLCKHLVVAGSKPVPLQISCCRLFFFLHTTLTETGFRIGKKLNHVVHVFAGLKHKIQSKK